MAVITIDLSRLQATLLTSGLQNRDQPLFQIITQLIKALQQAAEGLNVVEGGSGTNLDSLKNRTYITELDETPNLPVSRQLLAGTGITLDYSVFGEVTITADSVPEGYWTILTDGDVDEMDLITADGDVISMFVPL